MILEFKVKETEEKTLQETVQKALAQIEIKKYDAELKERGIPKERIRHYGVAFEGKKVLIGNRKRCQCFSGRGSGTAFFC